MLFILTEKALFVLEIFTFSFRLFGCVEKSLDEKAVVNLKIYVLTDWAILAIHIYYNNPISQEVKAIKQWNLVG